MHAGAQAHALNTRSLSAFPPLFFALEAPDLETLPGVFRAEFVGPGWLRRLAGPALALGGLGGWWGKVIEPGGAGVNLVRRHGRLERRFPFQVQCVPSGLDGRPAAVVHYARACPFPWPWIVDELRCLEAGCLLGMTYASSTRASGLLHRAAFPFLLHREAPARGVP